MSTLNNSVIICNTPPKSTRKEIGNKKPLKETKKTFYKNPIKRVRISRTRWDQTPAQKKLELELERQFAKINKHVETSCQDSIIILSDNENESDDQNQENKDTQVTKCSHKSNKFVEQEETEVTPRPRKRRKKDLNASDNNNTSCLLVYDGNDSEITTVNIDDENIVSMSDSVTQGTDDIVVVWSSTTSNLNTESQLKETETVNEKDNKKSYRRNNEENDRRNNEENDRRNIEEDTTRNEKENDRLFMIDCSPNINNLNVEEPIEVTISQNTRGKRKRYNQTEENDLIFNKKGLKLPKARDISNVVSMEKTKPIIKSLGKFKCRNLFATHSASDTNNSVPVTSTSNIYNTEAVSISSSGLREIVIDGNNIGLAYTNGRKFSEEGLKIVMDYFKAKGHVVKAFVPQYRRAKFHPLLEKLHAEGSVVFTPSRNVAGKWITPYDDRFIIQYATVCKGIVVSMDQYRDLYNEKPEWRDTIENRLLTPTFVGAFVMFPEDPLGRNGPRLDAFLRHSECKN